MCVIGRMKNKIVSMKRLIKIMILWQEKRANINRYTSGMKKVTSLQIFRHQNENKSKFAIAMRKFMLIHLKF